jgi:hypothetical protein
VGEERLEPFQSTTVTRKKVAGMDVASLRWALVLAVEQFFQLGSDLLSFHLAGCRLRAIG